jgi:hypothetical protein
MNARRLATTTTDAPADHLVGYLQHASAALALNSASFFDLAQYFALLSVV